MLKTNRFVMFSFLASVAAGNSAAAGLQPVAYELRQGSYLLDDCLFCERPVFQAPIRGTFDMTQLPVGFLGDLYRIDRIQFEDDQGGRYKVSGTGTLTVLGSLTLNLEIEVNGAPGGTLLADEPAANQEFWPPAFDLTASDKAPQDPLHVYTLRLRAAPVARNTVRYELIEGEDISELTDECLPPCKRATIIVPMKGTFELGEIAADSLFTTYRLDKIDFSSARGSNVYKVTGDGLYRQGGEFALVQAMDLDCLVNDQPGIKLRSELAVVGAAFPKISIELKQSDPPGIVVYSLKFLAQPAPSMPFRRGDADGDGETDITDAVGILQWLFVGGAAPLCLEAADVNGTVDHDISDAVYLLLYLFKSGSPPPAPGPDSCGAGPDPALGCDSYASC